MPPPTTGPPESVPATAAEEKQEHEDKNQVHGTPQLA